ncbi:MAG: DUF4957 domain-containing protein [Prevotella sp.]|nr:DUF4957 domain-containing protein [Prevotella sp.]
MKKLAKTSGALTAMAALLLLGSCAEGYESSSTSDLGVRNTKMQTPVRDSISFKVSTDGKTATVSWPTVAGANGHEVTFCNVDDPANPVVIDGYDKKIVDGSKFTISVAEDSKYQMQIRTLGNKDFGNTDDDSTHVYQFSTLVPSVATIPSGTDIAQYFQENPLDSNKTEVAVELEANGEYTLSGVVDFSHHPLTFRGDKVHRPVVHMTGDGHFETYSTLKVKFINFDMTESTAKGFVALSNNNLPDSIKTENRGNYWNGSSQIKGIYMVEDPIYIASCWFKNLPHAMLYHNEQNCAFWYFTVYDCIVQMNNTTKSNIGLINLYDSKNNGKSVKNITIENSTIYNIADNSAACFIRYSNESNSNPQKVFGTLSAEYTSHTWKFTHSTLAKCYYDDTSHSGWRFCNNVRVSTAFTLNIDHTIFYNCAQLYRFNNNSAARTFRFNFFWNDGNDDKSRNNSMKDTGNAPFASEYDPVFGGDNAAQLKELDFGQPNGGVNFTPTEYEIIANRGGDPRWLPATGGEDADDTEE